MRITAKHADHTQKNKSYYSRSTKIAHCPSKTQRCILWQRPTDVKGFKSLFSPSERFKTRVTGPGSRSRNNSSGTFTWQYLHGKRKRVNGGCAATPRLLVPGTAYQPQCSPSPRSHAPQRGKQKAAAPRHKRHRAPAAPGPPRGKRCISGLSGRPRPHAVVSTAQGLPQPSRDPPSGGTARAAAPHTEGSSRAHL